MKDLDVEFVRRRSPWALPLLAVSICLIAFSGVKAWSVAQMYQEVRIVEGDIHRLQSEIGELKRRQALAAQPSPYQKAAEHAVRAAEFPIDKAIATLELIAVPGVRLVSIDVNPINASAHAVVEAISSEALGQYLQELSAQKPESRWALSSIQTKIDGVDGYGAPDSREGQVRLTPGRGAAQQSNQGWPLQQPAGRYSTSAVLTWN